MLLGGLFFVETLQCAVVAFVEPPILHHAHRWLPKLCERPTVGFDCPRQQRGVHRVESQPCVAQRATSGIGFVFTPRAEGHVVPTSEQVQLVPGALAVAQQHQRASPAR